MLKKELYDLSKATIRVLTLDKQFRVVLGERFKGVAEVNMIGAGNHLILELKK